MIYQRDSGRKVYQAANVLNWTGKDGRESVIFKTNKKKLQMTSLNLGAYAFSYFQINQQHQQEAV